MRIAIVTGVYPPDIGGPATHAKDLGEELVRRGHRVAVVTISDRPNPETRDGIVRFPRRWSWQRRLAAVTRWLLDHGRAYDVVYALGLHPAAVAGARLAGRPVVVRVAGDPAWERAGRLGLTEADFHRFQGERSLDLRILGMRLIRDWSLRRATAITVPSRFMARAVRRWLRGPADLEIVPSAVRILEAPPGGGRDRGEMLEALFVGRLVPLKRVDVLLEAVAKTPGVTLEVIGDGPERASLERLAGELGADDRVRFVGVLAHDDVLARMASADVLTLASTVENFSHVVIEALASGTPVVAPGIGGIPEAVVDGVTGIIVEPATVDRFSEALSRLRDDSGLRARLSEESRRQAGQWDLEASVDRVEALLERAVRGKPRAVFVGKGEATGFEWQGLERKFDIYVRHLEPTILTTGRSGIRRYGATRAVVLPDLRPRLLGGFFFYGVGPVVALLLAGGRVRCAVVCQSPFEAFGLLLLARLLPRAVRPRVVVEVHADWRAAARLYGSEARTSIAPIADRLAEWSLRHADRVRAVGEFTAELARQAGYEGEIDRFPAFSDFGLFLDDPPDPVPGQSRAVFAGVLERSKGLDVLLRAWGRVLENSPEATLEIAGDGPMLPTLQRETRELGLGHSVRFLGHIPRGSVRDLLDRSSFLVLPSRSEGLGRVVLEAFARGRPVVGSRVGGIGELVEDGRTGLLVPPDDPEALATALVSLLEDPGRIRTMGEAGRKLVEERDPLSEHEAGVVRLARWIDEQSGAKAPADEEARPR